jgi:hypothetical protein
MEKNKELEVVEDMMDYIRAKGIFVKSKKDITNITNLLFSVFDTCKTMYTFNLFKHTQDFLKAIAFSRIPNLCQEIEINNNQNQYIMLDNVFDNIFNSEFGGGLMDDLIKLNKFPTIYSDSFILMEIKLNDNKEDTVCIEYRFLVLDADESTHSISFETYDHDKWHKISMTKNPIKDTKGYYESYMKTIQDTVKKSEIKNVLFDRYKSLEEGKDNMIKDFSYLLLCIFCVYTSLLTRSSDAYKIPLTKEGEN